MTSLWVPTFKGLWKASETLRVLGVAFSPDPSGLLGPCEVFHIGKQKFHLKLP